MRNIGRAIIIPALFLVGSFLAVCNSQAALVATVNIYNATIVSQENNKLKIGFDIYNRENIQPGIRYAVELNRIDGEDAVTLIDRKAYPEALTLGPDETVHKEVSYEIPSYLKGDFEVWVVSDSENGMPLGQGLAGNVKFEGNGSNAEIIFDSCNMKVEGEDKTYDLFYGVDVAASENLILSCRIKNNFPSETSLTPSFSTYYRNVYGDLISSVKQNPFKLAAGEEKPVDFTISKATNPQAYDVTLVLLGTDSKEISNKVTAHYVVQGQSASIQNIRFDKDSYMKGEAAKISFQWTGSADEFFGSRKNSANGGSLANNSLELVVKDRNSNSCADPYKRNLDESMPKNVSLDLQINKDCSDPTAYLSIKDAKGNILDSKVYGLTSQSSPKDNNGSEVEDKIAGSKIKYILFGLVAFLTILSLVLVFRSKMRSRGGINSVILLMLLGASLFLAAGQAKADTFTADGKSKECEAKYKGDWSDAVYSVSTDKTNYSYGDVMRVSTRIQQMSECGNGDEKGRVRGKFDKDWDDDAGKSQEWYREGDTELINVKNSGSRNKTKEFTVKRNPDGEPGGVPGQHFIDLVGGVYNPSGFDKQEKDLKTRCEAFVNALRDADKIKYNVLQPKRTLMVGLNSGDWSGNIRSTNQAGIDCNYGTGESPGCNAQFNEGSDVWLHATPGANFSNGVWESGCPGLPSQNDCRMNLASDKTATVRFTPKHTLWVGVGPNTGTENNKVESINIGGISCTSPNGGTAGCNAQFVQGQVIQLRATAGPNYYGGVWGNNCAGTIGDTCNLTMGGSDLVATISYTLKPNLKVTISGCGTVKGPNSWSCSSNVTCPPLYAYNTQVTLTTSETCPDYHFGSWSGACSGSSSCTVNMGTENKDVSAYFPSQRECSCDTQDCKSTCTNKLCDDSCGNETCKGTLSCADWVEVQP